MAVIWGLDLHAIQGRKFKSSYMFNDVYHLRKTKMIVYQLAMILCVCSESVGTAALDDYVKQQRHFQARGDGASIYNNDFVGIAACNIFVGVAVATIFGAGFFFDLFWPERAESLNVRKAWKGSAIVVSVMVLADAIALTYVVATRQAYFTGIGQAAGYALLRGVTPNPPLIYRHYGKCVAAVVLLWPGVLATWLSTVILFKSYDHNEKHGALSKSYIERAHDPESQGIKAAPLEEQRLGERQIMEQSNERGQEGARTGRPSEASAEPAMREAHVTTFPA